MKLYKLIPLLVPLAFFATAFILILLNACNSKPTSSWETRDVVRAINAEGVSLYVAPQNDCCETISFPMYEANCGCEPSREAIKAARDAELDKPVQCWGKRCERGLPHRPINELTNWGQGRNPGANDCPPGTVRYELDDGLFLECMR